MGPAVNMDYRGRRFQDNVFSVPDVAGLPIEELWASSEEPGRVEKVFLKLAGLPWQSFFLDAGLGFWGEYSDDVTFDGYEDVPRTDYGRLFGIVGQRLRLAECVALGPERAPRIVLDLESGGRVELRWMTPGQIESDSELVFVQDSVTGAG